MLSVWDAPVSDASTRLIVGLAGATPSTVTLTATDATETLPDVSVATAVSSCTPPGSAGVVNVHAPVPPAVTALPSAAVPLNT